MAVCFYAEYLKLAPYALCRYAECRGAVYKWSWVDLNRWTAKTSSGYFMSMPIKCRIYNT